MISCINKCKNQNIKGNMFKNVYSDLITFAFKNNYYDKINKINNFSDLVKFKKENFNDIKKNILLIIKKNKIIDKLLNFNNKILYFKCLKDSCPNDKLFFNLLIKKISYVHLFISLIKNKKLIDIIKKNYIEFSKNTHIFDNIISKIIDTKKDIINNKSKNSISCMKCMKDLPKEDYIDIKKEYKIFNDKYNIDKKLDNINNSSNLIKFENEYIDIIINFINKLNNKYDDLYKNKSSLLKNLNKKIFDIINCLNKFCDEVPKQMFYNIIILYYMVYYLLIDKEIINFFITFHKKVIKNNTDKELVKIIDILKTT